MADQVNRREFLNRLGVTVTSAAALSASAGVVSSLSEVRAAESPKGSIPSKPYKVGHMTYFTGFGAVFGEQSHKGHLLAAEEINEKGGLLGKRKIETIKADENAGTDANVKELRRMKLSEQIDMFSGITSSANTPALGPVAEELKVLTLFTDGCTDFLFDKAITDPKYVFRVTNIQSADGIMAAVATAMAWPEVRKVAHIHPDYAYGRNAFDHFNVVMKKLVPGVQIVSEAWPKLATPDFTPHITKAIGAGADLLFTSLWGSDYLAFYKQALRYDLFKKMKCTTTIAFGVAPHAIPKDHPEGIIAGVHANYYFTYPAGNRWPDNVSFVQKFYDRFKEYPNTMAEGAYTGMHMVRLAIEKANQLLGGWPPDEAIIAMLEGLSMPSPGGYISIRPDNHQAYKDGITGFSMNAPDYGFQVLDPKRIISVPIRSITAPPGWKKVDPTAAYTWVNETWPAVTG
jgi:branched-chain amino acid transport system substrate-binding protein